MYNANYIIFSLKNSDLFTGELIISLTGLYVLASSTKKNRGNKDTYLSTLANKSYLVELILNFDIICYNCGFEWWLCPLSFYVPKSHSVFALKTSVLFVFSEQWRIHLSWAQCSVIHSVCHSVMGRWIHFAFTTLLGDSDLTWINL